MDHFEHPLIVDYCSLRNQSSQSTTNNWLILLLVITYSEWLNILYITIVLHRSDNRSSFPSRISRFDHFFSRSCEIREIGECQSNIRPMCSTCFESLREKKGMKWWVHYYLTLLGVKSMTSQCHIPPQTERPMEMERVKRIVRRGHPSTIPAYLKKGQQNYVWSWTSIYGK